MNISINTVFRKDRVNTKKSEERIFRPWMTLGSPLLFLPLPENWVKWFFVRTYRASCYRLGGNDLQILRTRCKKDGYQANGTQRYECKHCHRKQQEGYTYNAYSPGLNEKIVLYTKEGTGIRSTARTVEQYQEQKHEQQSHAANPVSALWIQYWT